MSGYRDCACRDCFEIAIGEKGAMCSECKKAECEPDEDCKAPHAYGQTCMDSDCCGWE